MDATLRSAVRQGKLWEVALSLLRSGAFTTREEWLDYLKEQGLCVPEQPDSWPPCEETGCDHAGGMDSLRLAGGMDSLRLGSLKCMSLRCYLWVGTAGYCTHGYQDGHKSCQGIVASSSHHKFCRCPCHKLHPGYGS